MTPGARWIEHHAGAAGGDDFLVSAYTDQRWGASSIHVSGARPGVECCCEAFRRSGSSPSARPSHRTGEVRLARRRTRAALEVGAQQSGGQPPRPTFQSAHSGVRSAVPVLDGRWPLRQMLMKSRVPLIALE